MFLLKGEDKISHYSIIVLGVSTLGMSVLLWWLYKYCSGKDKDDVEGIYVRMYICMHYVCYTYVCTCVSVRMCVCIHVCLYTCVYVCILILCTHYTAHSAVPLSSSKSSKKYVL